MRFPPRMRRAGRHSPAGVKLAAAVIKEQQRCHAIRMGNLDAAAYPVTLDCSDLESLMAKAQQKIAKAAAKLTLAAEKKCQGGASPPEALGFLACGAPCDALPITSDYTSVAACLTCRIERIASRLDLALYGGLPDPPVQSEANDTLKCQMTIGGLAKKLAFATMKIQHACQYQEDRGTLSADCMTYDPKGKIAKLESGLIGKLDGKCSASDLASLGSCGPDARDRGRVHRCRVERRGRRDLRPRLRAAPRADADRVGHARGDGDPDRDRNTHRHGDSGADPDRISDANRDADRNDDRDRDADRHPGADGHGDPRRYGSERRVQCAAGGDSERSEPVRLRHDRPVGRRFGELRSHDVALGRDLSPRGR